MDIDVLFSSHQQTQRKRFFTSFCGNGNTSTTTLSTTSTSTLALHDSLQRPFDES